MRQKILYKIIIIASLVGLIISSYLTYNYYTKNNAICIINQEKSCDFVLNGIYSELLFDIPNSILGIIGFLIFIILCYISMNLKEMNNLIFYVSLIAFLFVLFLAYLVFFVISSFCLWCFVVWMLIIAIFICSIFLIKNKIRY